MLSGIFPFWVDRGSQKNRYFYVSFLFQIIIFNAQKEIVFFCGAKSVYRPNVFWYACEMEYSNLIYLSGCYIMSGMICIVWHWSFIGKGLVIKYAFQFFFSKWSESFELIFGRNRNLILKHSKSSETITPPLFKCRTLSWK